MNIFKLAFTNLACPDWTVEHAAAVGERLEYDGIELRLLNGEVIDPMRDRIAVQSAAQAVRAHGLEVCALDTSCSLNRSDTEQKREISVLRHWIDLAETLQVRVLRVFGGSDVPEPGETDAVGRVAQAFASVAPDAEQAGVTVCLETHDAFSSARRVAEVLDRVPSPAVAALWDSHHPYRAGEGADEVGVLLDGRLAHVHVKDARRIGDDDWELTLLGEGDVPVKQQLRVLERLGYTGYVSVEWEKKWNPNLPDPEIALPQHIDKLREWSRRDT